MNNRYGTEGESRKHLIALDTSLIGKWKRAMAVVLIVTFIGMAILPPGSALAGAQGSGTNSSDGTGIQVGSWLLSIPYCAGKTAFAIAGSTVGVLGYLFSGGNSAAAQSVWTSSVYGTYILRPSHLRGDEPIHFLGTPEDGRYQFGYQSENRAPLTAQSPKK
jgi:hypothetical protein